jgi:hypothetical protein
MLPAYCSTDFGSDARQWRWALIGMSLMVRAPFVSFGIFMLAVYIGLVAHGFGVKWVMAMAAVIVVAGFTLAHVVGLALACWAPADLQGRRYARAAGTLTVFFILSLVVWGGLELAHWHGVRPTFQRVAEWTPWLRDETFVRVIGVTVTVLLGTIGTCWLLFLRSTCECLGDHGGRRMVQELLGVHLGFTALITLFSTLAAGCFVVMLINPLTYFWHLIAVAHVRDRLGAALRTAEVEACGVATSAGRRRPD